MRSTPPSRPGSGKRIALRRKLRSGAPAPGPRANPEPTARLRERAEFLVREGRLSEARRLYQRIVQAAGFDAEDGRVLARLTELAGGEAIRGNG